ncbi:hypothetical protein GCM10011391_33370 [Pullulanibacillus camelliae]|uniref:YrhK domain-containing protein n=1 Tax=Pullulanibacillus camelliae TaxID=1707096 RepID=A0A8J2YLI2_9BACL|nr:YrhK family protein [Pullulanibacillus camelliae]GGE51884.1 hypothetical protein GCM10011391_33370 [Pullulanibacillus camelliae]
MKKEEELPSHFSTETQDEDFWRHHVTLHNRYEWLHIINDIVIALWFLIGSFLFFFEQYQTAGTWLFVIGSAQMLIRPLIRIAHKLHVGDRDTRNIHF